MDTFRIERNTQINIHYNKYYQIQEQIYINNLLNLFNFWLQNKRFSNNFFTFRLLFIIKKGKDISKGAKIDDCRPISITSPLYKILEAILLKRINKLINTKTIKPISEN